MAGSFLEEPSLEGVSDIDLVVVVERLDRQRFDRAVAAFDAALRGELAAAGYDLRINPTLGPLKFNDPATAVLHLMLYTREAHVDHAIASPFTCFDWQRSAARCKRTLAEMFPVFGLQPHHFMSSRRSVRDYLRDFDAGVVSYRELACASDGYSRGRPQQAHDAARPARVCLPHHAVPDAQPGQAGAPRQPVAARRAAAAASTS